jgi:Uma2 family endonuclease
MTVSAPKKYWTDEELLAMPKDGHEREVIDGELIVSPAGYDHGVIIGRISAHLGAFIVGTDIGEILSADTGCRMKSGDLFSPDISFVTAARHAMQKQTGKPFFAGAPDLAVEVLSPGDTVGATEEKIAQYFENGTRLAWIVHPRTRSVGVYHGATPDKFLTASDSLDGEAVVPGFTVPLAQIFK